LDKTDNLTKWWVESDFKAILNQIPRTVSNTYVTKYRIIRNYDFIVFYFAQQNTIIHCIIKMTPAKV